MGEGRAGFAMVRMAQKRWGRQLRTHLTREMGARLRSCFLGSGGHQSPREAVEGWNAEDRLDFSMCLQRIEQGQRQKNSNDKKKLKRSNS